MKNAISQAVISSNQGDILNAKCRIQGSRGVCSLSNVKNVSKEVDPRVPAKPTKIIVESFFKRPSLGDQAMDGIMNMVKDGVLVEQSYHYRTEAEVGAIFFMGDHFRIAQAGDIVVLHFVDGMLLNPEVLSAPSERPSLGSEDYEAAEVTEAAEFGHGENTFLLCTREFAQGLSEEIIEEALQKACFTIDEKRGIMSYDCNRWLKALRDIFEESHMGKEYTAIAFSIPAKRQRPKSIIVIVIIVIAILVAIFFLMGALRRGKGAPPGGGPGQGPGQGQQQPFDPAGGT